MRKRCQFCDGSGQCAQCNGRGSYQENGNYIECADCYSDGKCAECRGTGEGRGLFAELWDSYWSLGYKGKGFADAVVVMVGLLSVIFWQVMLPFLGVVAAVVLDLHWSRERDSL